MVYVLAGVLPEGLVSERDYCLVRCADARLRAVDIEVVLGPMPQVVTEQGPLCEAFQYNELNIPGLQSLRYFPAGMHGALVTDCVVGKIALEA
jgi:hypothetical protein